MAPAIDEFDLIARFFEPLARDLPGAMGLRDDAGALRLPPGQELIVSADAIVAGIHFPKDTPSGDIARRALRVNLSDIAAKGATPLAYTLTLQLPEAVDDDWLRGFADVLDEDQKTYGLGLLGGDTSRTDGPLTLSINIFGQCFENKWIKRSGACVGEEVYVTGTIGDATLGLAIEQGRIDVGNGPDRDFLRSRFFRPEPRVETGPKLLGLASAAADVSDGLIADLGHICAASSLGVELDFGSVPLSPAAERLVTDHQPLGPSLLSGGDDYEIVFTAPERARGDIDVLVRETGVAMTRIGRTVEHAGDESRVKVFDDAGRELEVRDGGYRHFGKKVSR